MKYSYICVRMQACVQNIKNSLACLNVFPSKNSQDTTIINRGRWAFIYMSIKKWAREFQRDKPLELDPPNGNQLGPQICNGIKERDYWMAITKFDMGLYLLLPFFEEFQGHERCAWQTHPVRIFDKWLSKGSGNAIIQSPHTCAVNTKAWLPL